MNRVLESKDAAAGFGHALSLVAVAALFAVLGENTPASAAVAETSNYSPPPLVLLSEGGRQRAAQESYCISVPGGATLCADSPPGIEPRWLSVVRPKEHVTIRVRGATTADGSVYVHPRGCERGFVQTFKIKRPTKRWVVHLDPGRYELSVFARFTMGDGRAGDTSGQLGLLVSMTRVQELIPVNDNLACQH
jgi:hypothetical protein